MKITSRIKIGTAALCRDGARARYVGPNPGCFSDTHPFLFERASKFVIGGSFQFSVTAAGRFTPSGRPDDSDIVQLVKPALSWARRRILAYLRRRANVGRWISPTRIGLDLGSTRHSAWASPKCRALVALGHVTRNKRGHYRAQKES